MVNGRRKNVSTNSNGGQWTWDVRIDNIGIKSLDVFADPVESISISGPSAVSLGQSINLTAGVLPVTAPSAVAWSIKSGGESIIKLASVTDNSCSVEGVALGTDTVIATASDGSGVVAKHAVKVTGQLVESITIGGDKQLNTIYLPTAAAATLQLTATVAPENAVDKAYTWSSNRPVATVDNDGKVEITAATLDTVTITATASDDGHVAASYTFIVDSRGLTSAAYDYTGYDYIDLFNNGSSYMNGAIGNAVRGGVFSYDATNSLLKLKSNDTNLGRRQYYTFNEVVEASQKLIVEFDWYAIPFVKGTADDVELQATFMDAYAMENTTDPAPHEVFTIYHVNGTSDAFGLVAGPLNADASLSKTFNNQNNGDPYYASRRGATTEESRRRVVSAPLSTWYHIKAEVDIVNLNIKFTVTKKDDGVAVGDPFTLSLPANFSMVDGIGRILSNGAGTSGTHTADDRLDNLAIKNADEFTPGQEVESISITQLEGLTTVIAGKTTQLRATVLPVNAENRKLTWSSTEPTYATVDQGGLVSGLEAGIGQTVGIVAAATDGSKVTDTLYMDVIAQPVTGITVAGNSTHYIVSQNTETATLTATVTPEDASSKLLTWTTASEGDIIEIKTVNATTDTVTILLKTFGADTIIATAADGRGAVAKFPVMVVLNPYPGYQYVETFNAALNGAVPENGLRGNPVSIGAKDADNPSDRVLKYSETNSAGRASVYNFNSVINFTQKAVVEFDLNLQQKASGEGIISFMSNSTPSDNDNHDVFSIFAVNDATGFGVSVGYIPRNAYTNSSFYEYVDAPRRVQESVLATNKSWVPAPISADIWYHVQAVIYVNERIDFLFTRGADTFRITLPTTEALKTSIGAINLAGTNGLWTSAVDNIGIRVADNDAVVPATGVKVSSEYDKVSLGGNIPVTAAVLPWDVTSHAVTWGVANPAIATVAVDDGNPSWVATLTGVSGGTAKVFATVDGTAIADTLSVPVQVILVDSLYIQGSTSVSVGHSITITKSNAEVWPANAGDKSVTWSASNASVSIAPSGDTCIVTGVNAGAGERDSVLIIGAAADGGGAADTIKVYVEFTHATRLDLQGDRRVFYSATPPTGTTIALTPAFTPSTASDVVITGYESTDPSILTVDNSGVATLAGGYGKAAVKAVAHDGGLEGYYYVEVAAQNPYDEFNDFEAPLHNDPALKLDTFAFYTTGFSASQTSFRGTQAIHASVSGATGDRGAAIQLIDGGLTGERITLRFDFFAGKTGGSGNTFAYGSVSIKDNGTPNANAGYNNSILSIAFVPDTVPGHNFFYYTGNYLFNVAYPEDGNAERLPGTQALRDTSPAAWGFLPSLSTLDAWYTLEATIDNYLHTVSFTITELDAPEHTHTVAQAAFPSTIEPVVGSIYVFGKRISPNGLSQTSAIDNIAYKSIDSLEHISVTLNPDGGIFSGDDISVVKVLPAVANEPIASLPEISRTGYTFAGWRNADGTAYAETDVYTANTELTAAWDIICYMVHFDGIDLPDTCVNHGTKAVRPGGGEDPERECYDFEGWYYPNGLQWSFNTDIIEPVTIVAKWTAIANCNPDSPSTAVASDVLSAVLLYPNPASDFVTVSGLGGGEAISVIDAGGSLLFTRRATSDKESIAVGTLPSGIYYVQVAKGKATKTLKLTVK
ncbi:MAG: Ig-like domain-containing protein [Prevotellaceae bacterium]|nr:Ig-like domain-containing protein [Prevotellaceae bacterium]